MIQSTFQSVTLQYSVCCCDDLHQRMLTILINLIMETKFAQ